MKTTPNYGLKKPDPEDFYNVGDFNDNADAIDAALTPTADPSQIPTGNGPGKLSQWVGWLTNRIKAITGKANWWESPTKSLEQLNNDVNAHLADLTSQEVGKGADMIAIPDPNGLFTASNVREALYELFTSVSDGKTQIAAAITDMGGTASGSDTFQQLADAIRAISAGKKWASGTTTVFLETYYTVQITGLDFKPGLVLMYLNNKPRIIYYHGISTTGGFVITSSDILQSQSNNFQVGQGLFKIAAPEPTGTVFNWIAIEE